MKVWIDVSGLYRWYGNFTGIQRVVYNIAKELEASELDSGMFIYHSGTFKEISSSELNKKVEELSKIKHELQSERESLTLKKIVYITLVTSKKLVKNTVFEPFLRTTYRFARRSYNQLLSLNKTVHIKNIFKPDDIVVIVDGNWQFGDFAESIITKKRKINFKLVHFVQDMVAVNNPSLVNKGASKIIGEYFNKIFRVADQLIAISKSTKKDVEAFLDSNNITIKPKISVIRLGDSIIPENTEAKKPNIELPKKYILSVSTVEVRKNYSAFYYVYNLAHQKGIDLPDLVIVGKKGWMAEEAYSLLTKDPKINNKITILNTPDAELEWLYENCMFSVFPSFYEGWGLPVAESLAHGKCCISSDTSSMPEVGGDLVNYVSPYDTAAMLDKIVKLTDEETRKIMEKRIASEYKTVTWQDTFSEFKNLIREI